MGYTVAMFGLKPTELLIILALVLLLFGAKKLPGLARSLGSSATEFKKGLSDGGEDEEGSAPDGEPSDS